MRLKLPCKCPAQLSWCLCLWRRTGFESSYLVSVQLSPHGVSVHGIELVMRLELPCKCPGQPSWCPCLWRRTGYETSYLLSVQLSPHGVPVYGVELVMRLVTL